MNGLTVVIPSRNMWNLGPCIEAIQKHEPDVKVLVVDDTGKFTLPIEWNDPKRSYSGLVGPFDTWANVKKVSGWSPFNFARNCNIGIFAATHYPNNDQTDVILLNDDALLETPSGFTAMQREAEAHPEFGIIGATTNLTGQPLQWSADRHPGVMPGLREVPWLAFVCVLIPRRTIERVGLLDERYCLDYGGEDRDYCQSVKAQGLKVGVYDYCFVDHSKLTSTFRGSPTGQRSSEKNKALFMEKWPGVEF